MVFCYKMLYNCSWWFNLINLVICEKLKFLRLETTQIGVLVQLGVIWRNWLVRLIQLIIIMCYLSWVVINWSISLKKKNKWLVRLIQLIIIMCYLSWVMINWLISLKLNKWFFKFWGFCYKLYAQANFLKLKLNWTYSHSIRACIICLYYSCII